jgi:transposase
MYYGGIDAHKSYLTVVIVDQDGNEVHRDRRVPIGDGEPLMATLEGFRPLEVVVETCPFWPWIYDRLEATEIGFHLAHASDLQAIARARTKTDSIDAELLARMLATNLIPEAYPKPASQREVCYLVRHRATLVRDRTRCCNRIHNQLQQRGLQLQREKLLRTEGREWLQTTAWSRLSPEQQNTIRTQLQLIDTVSPMIEALDMRIKERAGKHPEACLLRTIPGIGPYRSLLLIAEILPVSRFPSPDSLVAYGGLAPTTRQSGTSAPRHGQIPRAANRWIRGELISAIPTHLRIAPDSALSQYYEEQKGRLGWATARVATARKLCRMIHAMLSTGEVWRV